jgi:hypothetical protein
MPEAGHNLLETIFIVKVAAAVRRLAPGSTCHCKSLLFSALTEVETELVLLA